MMKKQKKTTNKLAEDESDAHTKTDDKYNKDESGE